MALLGPLPKPAWFGNGARLGYIVAVRLIETILANILLWSSTEFYPRYAVGERLWRIRPLADQSIAGAVMMVEGSFVTLCLFGWLFWRAASEAEERQALVELAEARGVELSEQRAARAVAAGAGETLRRRIVEGRAGGSGGAAAGRVGPDQFHGSEERSAQ
jgi:cytochrome c oxidase assembly factor CtaG